MWAVVFVVLVNAVLLGTAWKYGVRFAIGCTALLSLLVPSWLRVWIAEIPIDASTCAGVFGLVWVCFNRRACFRHGLLPFGFVVADYCLISLAVVQTISDWLAFTAPVAVVPLRAYGEWMIPYFLGRFSVLDTNDLRKLAPVALAVCLVLSIGGVVEGLTHQNPFELIVGNREELLAPRHIVRFGVKRAYGPVEHSIFFGMLLLYFAPWQALRWFDANAAKGRVAHLAGMAMWLMGACFSGSRSVLAAIVVTAVSGLFAMAPRLRRIVGGGVFCLVMVAGFYFAQLVESAMHATKQEVREDLYRTIVINGKKRPYTGTRSRIYAFELYQPALMQTGLFGFGTDRTTGFPIRVPLRPGDEGALVQMPTVENAYLLMALRLGWLGLAAFSASVCAFVYSSFQAFSGLQAKAERAFAALLFAVFLTTALVLASVWMPHDFGFMLLWSAGIASSLGALVSARKTGSDKPTVDKALPKQPVKIDWDAV